MCVPLINRREPTVQERMNAFMKVREYHRKIYPNYADPGNRSSLVDIAAYLERFNADFYNKANEEDSIEKKELKDCWKHDQECTGLPISFTFWLPRFRQTMDQARPTSLHR